MQRRSISISTIRRAAMCGAAFCFILWTGVGYTQTEMVPESASVSFLSGSVDVDLTPDDRREDFQAAELGMKLLPGTLIRTGQKALCEITMPDGSTVKISSGTVFQITRSDVDSETGKRSQWFDLLFGKVRAKVQKFIAPDSEFEIVSGTALAGVRGTDFAVTYDGVSSRVLVFEGSVDLGSLTESFEPVVLSGGQMSALPAGGVPEPPVVIPADTLQDWQSEADMFPPSGEQKAASTPETSTPEAEEKPVKQGGLSRFLSLNALVGMITVDDQVYERWVFTPELRFGKLSAGLYLPAVFTPDVGLFAFSDWQNRDQWDFSDGSDGFNDFITKFSYLQWAQPGDPFYARIGGIDELFLGHGFIVDDYSNTLFFPEKITVGLRLDLDSEKGGIQAMVGDFSRFQLVGGRMYLRPLGRELPVSLGVTGVTDRPKPDSAVWGGFAADRRQLPRIFVFGVDADLPVLRLESSSMNLYVDAAKLGYSYQEVPGGLTSYVDPGSLEFVKGAGTAFGLAGKIASRFGYRAEYRYIVNYYEPELIGYFWENRRLTYFQELYDLIVAQNDPAFDDSTTAGVFLEGSVSFLTKLEVGLGYESYKKSASASSAPEPVKKGMLFLRMGEGLIPRLHGSLTYRRADELETVLEQPFDENTALDAHVVYQFSPMIGLSLLVNRTYEYDDKAGVYDAVDLIGISTVFTFF
jgi:hypothetical protein